MNNKLNLSVNLDGTLSEDTVIEQLPSQQFSILKIEKIMKNITICYLKMLILVHRRYL